MWLRLLQVRLFEEHWPQKSPIHGLNALNTLRSRQNRHHFADDIFKCIFFNENAWILIQISLKFVPKGPINNIPASVQIMAWRRPGDKRLSEPMMARLPTHICVTQPQWVDAGIGHVRDTPCKCQCHAASRESACRRTEALHVNAP